MPAHLESIQRLVEDSPWPTPVGTRLGRVRSQDWGGREEEEDEEEGEEMFPSSELPDVALRRDGL